MNTSFSRLTGVSFGNASKHPSFGGLTLPTEGLILKALVSGGLVDSVGVSPKEFAFTSPTGAVAYVDNAVIGGPSFTSPSTTYDPTTRTVGSGSATVYSTVEAALTAIVTGGRVYLMPGTYAAAQIGTTNVNLAAKVVELYGYTGDKDEVILNMTDFASYLARPTAAGGKLTCRFFTVKNCGASYLFYTYGGGSFDIQWCRFVDTKQSIVRLFVNGANNSELIFTNNVVNGQSGDVGLTKNLFDIERSSTGLATVKIRFNKLLPSNDNSLSSLLGLRNLTIDDNVEFTDNIQAGCITLPIYISGSPANLVFKNNISLGAGLTFAIGEYTISADTPANLANVDWNYNLVTNLGAARKYDPNVPGTKTSDINSYAKVKSYPCPAYVGIVLDDASAVAYAAFDEYIESLGKYGVSGTWVVNVGSYINNYTAYNYRMKAWLDGGNEIGSHGFNHSSLIDWTEAIIITNSTGGAKTVTISCDTSTGADWNGINKDYTGWTGSLQLEGETAIDLSYQSGAFPTLIEVANQINALAGWSATVQPDTTTDAITPYVAAIVLADYSASIANSASTGWLPADKTEYLWLEIKQGKDVLEQYIKQNIAGYSDYEVSTYGCGYNKLDLDGMDVMMEAGFSICRGNNDTTQLSLGVGPLECDRFNLRSFAKYAVFVAAGTAVAASYDEELNAGIINAVGAFGGVVFYAFHVTDFVQANFEQFLADISVTSNINVVTGKELDAVIGTLPTTGTTGSTLRVNGSSLYDVYNQDVSIDSTSLCIDSGVDLFSAAYGDIYDADGYMVRHAGFDALVYHARGGKLSIGPYQYGGATKVYNTPTKVSGTSMADYVLEWPICPTLLDADDGTIYTSYVPNQIDFATFTALDWMRFGIRGVAMWNPALDAIGVTKADTYLKAF